MRIFILLILVLFLLCVLSSVALASDDEPSYDIELTFEERRNAHIITAAVSLVLAFAIPGIVTAVWTRQLKSVKPKDFACDYIRRGSMNLSLRRDIFLYRNVTRVAKPQNNNSNIRRR